MNHKNCEECLEKIEIPEKDRVIWVTNFNDASAAKVCKAILEKSDEDPNEPIILYIDSYGGYVDALAAMVSTIDGVPNKIVTVAMGKAMSCGAMLLSYGDFRYAGSMSTIMVHEISAGAWGNIHDMKNDTKWSDRENDKWMNWLAKNCNIKNGYKGLRKLLPTERRDLYLTPKEAVKFGIVDSVGIPKVEVANVIKTYSVSYRSVK